MILITGATGFLGRHIVDELLSKGHEIRILVRNPENRKLPWESMVEIVDGDILDLSSLEKGMDGVETVVHAAAQVSFWKKQHKQMMKINVEGTANVINVSLDFGIKKFIHISSTGALGKRPAHDLIDETTPWTPSKRNSKYAISKHKAELEIHRGIAEGLPEAVMINPGVILGPTYDWNQNTGKIFSLIHKGLRFHNHGASGFVGVQDVAKAVSLMVENAVPSGSRFILVSENMPQKKIMEQIAVALGEPPPSIPLSDTFSMVVARVSQILAYLTQKEPIITPESIRSSISRSRYDGSKITQMGMGFEYTPIDAVVKTTANAFLKDHQESLSSSSPA